MIALDGRGLGFAPINGDLVGQAVAANRLVQEAPSCRLIALLAQQKGNGLAVLVHRTLEIGPLAFHFHRGLVHAPAHPQRMLAPVECLFKLWTGLHPPTIHRRVVNRNPPFLYEFFGMACAQRVRETPTAPHEDELWGELRTLEPDRYRLAPS